MGRKKAPRKTSRYFISKLEPVSFAYDQLTAAWVGGILGIARSCGAFCEATGNMFRRKPQWNQCFTHFPTSSPKRSGRGLYPIRSSFTSRQDGRTHLKTALLHGFRSRTRSIRGFMLLPVLAGKTRKMKARFGRTRLKTVLKGVFRLPPVWPTRLQRTIPPRRRADPCTATHTAAGKSRAARAVPDACPFRGFRPCASR